jgi:hypothetical protein
MESLATLSMLIPILSDWFYDWVGDGGARLEDARLLARKYTVVGVILKPH